MRTSIWVSCILAATALLSGRPNAGLTALAAENKKPALTVVVMDPLAAPLSCPCVKGYAQRDYEKLGKHLEAKLGQAVEVHFSDSLALAIAKKTGGKADLVIGKDSVVRFEAKSGKLDLTPIASLTDKQGSTTQTGLIVVASADKAVTLEDLKGYKFILGNRECDEKHAAVRKLFNELGVALPEKPETCGSCSDGALKILDLQKSGEKSATVISSYAQPLLEGCGTIKKGDLRVVGETEPVAFVTAFVSDKLSAADRAAVIAALLEVGQSKDLCTALETKSGFVKPGQIKKKN